jgi:hypothetical protein
MTGKVVTVMYSPENTVLQVKEAYFAKEGIPVAHQQLVHNHVTLEDTKSLREYGIENETTVFMVQKLQGGC